MVFESPALPGEDGERWIWTSQEGFRSSGKIQRGMASPDLSDERARFREMRPKRRLYQKKSCTAIHGSFRSKY
jgi:hypothetical protein